MGAKPVIDLCAAEERIMARMSSSDIRLQALPSDAWTISAFRGLVGQRDVWTALAKRCYISRSFARQCALLVCYGGGDPWLRQIVITEMRNICFSGQ